MKGIAGFCILVLVFCVSVLAALPASAQTVATVSIGDVEAMPDSIVSLPLRVDGVTNLSSGTIHVTYNPSVVHVIGVASGTVNALPVRNWNINNTAGTVQIVAWDTSTPHSGDVIFACVSFNAVGSRGSTPLTISVIDLKEYDYPYPQIHHAVTNGTFTITPMTSITTPPPPSSASVPPHDDRSDSERYESPASGYASVSIADVSAPPDGCITVPIVVNHVTNLGSGAIDVAYNPEIVHVTTVESGAGNALVVQSQNISNTLGLVQIVAWDANAPHSGTVVFANLVCKAVGSTGSAPLTLTVRDLTDYHNYTVIPHAVNDGTFTIPIIAASQGNTSTRDTITTRTIATAPPVRAPSEPEKPALPAGPIAALIAVGIAFILISETKRKR